MFETASLRVGLEPYPGYLPHRPFAFVASRAFRLIRHIRHPNLPSNDRVWCPPGYLILATEPAGEGSPCTRPLGEREPPVPLRVPSAP